MKRVRTGVKGTFGGGTGTLLDAGDLTAFK